MNSDRAQEEDGKAGGGTLRDQPEEVNGGEIHRTGAHPRAERRSIEVEAFVHYERQVKTIKFTSPSTATPAMHEIRGRSSAPGPVGERGGQAEAARGTGVSTNLPIVGQGIRGRSTAPGGVRAGRISGTRGDGAAAGQAATQDNVICEGEVPNKRRRVTKDGMKYGEQRDSLQHDDGAARLQPCTSGSSCWSSRKALLDSLRSGVRPPEGLA